MAAIVLAALLLIPCHLLARLLGAPDAVPPRFLRLLGRIAGLRVRCEGAPAPGALLLANHVSWLDVLALAGTARARFVAHSGLAANGPLRWLCAQNRTVFITRDRRATVARQIAQVRAALTGRPRPLVIFPEATTGDGRALLPFRSSLLAAAAPLADAVPIQPVALDYAESAAIAWGRDEPGLANMRTILARRRPVELVIRFLPPLAGPALADRKAMSAAARAAIAAALDSPPRMA